MSLNYSPQRFSPIYPCHSPDFTGGQTEAAQFAGFLCQSESHWWGCGCQPFLAILQSEFQVQEHLCLQVYHTNIIHKSTALLLLRSSDLSSLKMSHPNAVPSQNYGTWIFTNVINFTSVSCPIGVLHHSTDKCCNWRIEALGCEKWRNHSLRCYICSFFVGGFVLIVN